MKQSYTSNEATQFAENFNVSTCIGIQPATARVQNQPTIDRVDAAIGTFTLFQMMYTVQSFRVSPFTKYTIEFFIGIAFSI